MSMSTHIVGIAPPDENWKKMKAIWDACMEAKVDLPQEVIAFFNGGETPDEKGVLVDLERKTACVSEYNDDSASGLEVDLDKLPPHIKILRFYNAW